MKIFVTGTDTGIGKTVISSWLALHTGFDYFKPIQTGCMVDTPDSETVSSLSGVFTWPELFSYGPPVAPYLAASMQGEVIEWSAIKLPKSTNIIIEGAGGVLVPINDSMMMIDLIRKFEASTIVVASSRLGTINHTLLTLEALRARNIEILGVIVNGEENIANCVAIEQYGKIRILKRFPQLKEVNRSALSKIVMDFSIYNGGV